MKELQASVGSIFKLGQKNPPRAARTHTTVPLAIGLIPNPDQGGFTACLPDIPVYDEGETENEAIRGYIETFGNCGRVSPRLA